MSLLVQIIDGNGTKSKAMVNPDGSLSIIAHPQPPFLPQKTKIFRQFLTDDGTPSGSNDMGVDGSSTNVDFWIPANEIDDRYITTLYILIAYGTSGKPYLWADGASLSNGSRLFYKTQKGEIDIHDAIKSNQDVFRLNGDLIPTAWEVRHTNANNDYGYFMRISLSEIMPPFGIKLDAGTTQKLIMRVRDNAGTDADTFNVIAMGFDRFK